MKRFMLVVLMVLVVSGFVGGLVACQDDKASPPTKEETTPKE